MKLATDYPLLNIKYDFLDTIHVPNIKMCSPGYFEMLACDYKLNNNIEIPGCLRYKAEAEELGVALITLDFISHNFNPLLKMDKAVELRLQLQGIFVPAIVDRVSLVKFRTKTYNSIPPWNFGSIFGLPPTYHTTSSIECLVNYFPFNQDPYNMPIGTNGYFSISPGDFIVEETSEKRTTTILSIFGSAGGAFGIVMNTLAFLFGSSRLDPWGFVRRISIDKWYFIRRQYDDIIVPYDKIDFKQYLNFYNGNMA
ncbi:unnamed protein product [Rhizophagus irregularis]|nr:unnamed protein product [Rhizophagus irregularis]